MWISLAASHLMGSWSIDAPDDYTTALELLFLVRDINALCPAIRRKTGDTALRPES